MNEYELMSRLIERELDKAYDELAKWHKTFKELWEFSGTNEYYAAKEELEKAKANCLFWIQAEKDHYAMSA